MNHQVEDANVAAFLTMLSVSEGTALQPDPYRVCYGYRHTIASFSDHPAVTGEWRGETLPAEMCRCAGLQPGCKSTAAGRYQFIRATWLGLKRLLALQDFSPYSQDRAALRLIEEQGALADVRAGRVIRAIRRVRRQWASLPGSGWGQPEHRASRLLQAFRTAGGTVAADDDQEG